MIFYAGLLSMIAVCLLFAGLLFGFAAVGILLLAAVGVLLLVGRVMSAYGRWKDAQRFKAREWLRLRIGPNAQIPRMGRRRIIQLYKTTSYRLAFSPNSHYLAADVDDDQVHVWDLIECQFICSLEMNEQVLSIEFAPNSCNFAVGTTNRILIIDAPSGKQVRLLEPVEWPAELKFSPDGRHLASTNDDYGPLSLWEVGTGTRLWSSGDHEGFAGLDFSPDGRQLSAIGSPHGAGRVRRWQLDDGRVVPLPPL